MLSEPGGRLSLAGEVKWAKREDGARILRALVHKAHASHLIPREGPEPVYVLAARYEVTGTLPGEVVTVTADDVFA